MDLKGRKGAWIIVFLFTVNAVCPPAFAVSRISNMDNSPTAAVPTVPVNQDIPTDTAIVGSDAPPSSTPTIDSYEIRPITGGASALKTVISGGSSDQVINIKLTDGVSKALTSYQFLVPSSSPISIELLVPVGAVEADITYSTPGSNSPTPRFYGFIPPSLTPSGSTRLVTIDLTGPPAYTYTPGTAPLSQNPIPVIPPQTFPQGLDKIPMFNPTPTIRGFFGADPLQNTFAYYGFFSPAITDFLLHSGRDEISMVKMEDFITTDIIELSKFIVQQIQFAFHPKEDGFEQFDFEKALDEWIQQQFNNASAEQQQQELLTKPIQIEITSDLIRIQQILQASYNFHPLLRWFLQQGLTEEERQKFLMTEARRRQLNALLKLAKRKNYKIVFRLNGKQMGDFVAMPPISAASMAGTYEVQMIVPNPASHQTVLTN